MKFLELPPTRRGAAVLPYRCPCRSLSHRAPLSGYPTEGQTRRHSGIRIKQMAFGGDTRRGVRSGCCASCSPPCSPQNRSIPLSDSSRFAAHLLWPSGCNRERKWSVCFELFIQGWEIRFERQTSPFLIFCVSAEMLIFLKSL